MEEEVYAVMGSLRKFNLYYLEAGLIEALWVVIRKVSRNHLNIVNRGLKTIGETYRPLEPPVEAYVEAVKIYDLGHRGFIDAIHYTTALHVGAKWLTIDRTFVSFLKNNNLRTDVVLLPEDLV